MKSAATEAVGIPRASRDCFSTLWITVDRGNVR